MVEDINMGRPTDYTPEKADYIIGKLTNGIPLEEICREDNMPSSTTVRAWAKRDPDGFGISYALARENGEDLLAISLRRVANGDEGFSTGDVQRDKLKIETDFKLLKVFNPKKYGEKVTNEHTGVDGAPFAVLNIFQSKNGHNTPPEAV